MEKSDQKKFLIKTRNKRTQKPIILISQAFYRPLPNSSNIQKI